MAEGLLRWQVVMAAATATSSLQGQHRCWFQQQCAMDATVQAGIGAMIGAAVKGTVEGTVEAAAEL